MSKWAISENGEIFDGGFETREDAIQALGSGGGFIGVQRAPQPPWKLFSAWRFLEDDVTCSEDYSVETAEGWASSVTKEMEEELERAVEPVIRAWIEKYRLQPYWFNVDDVEEVPSKSEGLRFPSLVEQMMPGVDGMVVVNGHLLVKHGSLDHLMLTIGMQRTATQEDIESFEPMTDEERDEEVVAPGPEGTE